MEKVFVYGTLMQGYGDAKLSLQVKCGPVIPLSKLGIKNGQPINILSVKIVGVPRFLMASQPLKKKTMTMHKSAFVVRP